MNSTTYSPVEIQKVGEVYAVAKPDINGEVNYLIYKLDLARGKDKDDDVMAFGSPIGRLEPVNKAGTHGMSIFSLGTNIYFVGGYRFQTFRREAYMFNITTRHTFQIRSMKFVKPSPFVFGPVDGRFFYIFSGGNKHGVSCLEILDTETHTWRSVEVPDFFDQATFHATSALCGSNILLTESFANVVYVFNTRTEQWRTLTDDESDDADGLPFVGIAANLLRDESNGHHIFLLPEGGRFNHEVLVYSTPILSTVKNDDYEYDPVATFEYRGNVGNLNEYLKEMPEFLEGWGAMEDIYCFNSNTICTVRRGRSGICRCHCFVFNLFNVSCSSVEGNKVQVKVEKASQYKYKSEIPLSISHLLVVA